MGKKIELLPSFGEIIPKNPIIEGFLYLHGQDQCSLPEALQLCIVEIIRICESKGIDVNQEPDLTQVN